MRAFSLRALRTLRGTAALAAVGLLGACTDLGVGRKCINSVDGAVQGTEVSSPALECMSRLCLLKQQDTGNPDRAVCTSFCDTDDDCSKATSSASDKTLCDSNFVCAIATVAGPFACRKMCICRSDLTADVNQDPIDGGVQVPSTCCAANTSGPMCPVKKPGT